MEKRGGEKLPAVGRAQSVVAQGEVFADESRLVNVEEKLGHENRDVQSDQAKKNEPGPLDPGLRDRRRFATGEAHVIEGIPTQIRCRWNPSWCFAVAAVCDRRLRPVERRNDPCAEAQAG